jgi:hypothetical protein
MKLISTEHGQVLLKFIAEEVRPSSGLYLPDILRGIEERYAFVIPPNLQDVLKEGAKFNQGRLIAEGRTIDIKTLGLFSDGVLVLTWNTDDATIVLEDMMSWATEHFGFRQPLTPEPRQFVSSVVVEFDGSLDSALEAFQELMHAFSITLRASYGWSVEIEASRIALACDPTKLPPSAIAALTIERRAGVPFSQNRYFSSAPLPTGAHLELLDGFERQLTKKRT